MDMLALSSSSNKTTPNIVQVHYMNKENPGLHYKKHRLGYKEFACVRIGFKYLIEQINRHSDMTNRDRKFKTAFFTSIPRYQNWSFLKDYDQMVSFKQTLTCNQDPSSLHQFEVG